MVKIFTIVKDEVDIVRDWIIYHGSIFGWKNIYIIDNYSVDGTFEIINEYKSLINIYREPDYRKKGIYMKNLIDKYCINNDHIAFPIDIDEFIVYYDKNSNNKLISTDKNLILKYINNLPKAYIYKCAYIDPILITNNKDGLENACKEIDYGVYNNYLGSASKSFIDKRFYKEDIDHGNHFLSNDYYLTNICLVHYHYRNLNQLKKKIYNNIIGLGYKDDLNNLKEIITNNPYCGGNQHISDYIKLWEGKFKFKIYNENQINKNDSINIIPLKNTIKKYY